MKKFLKWGCLFLIAVVTVSLTACSDDDNNDEDVLIDYEALPADAKTFISQFYPGITVTRVEKDMQNGNVEDYEVYFANRHDVTFDSVGQWINVDAPDGQTIPDGITPQPIVTYLNGIYPAGYGINEISKNWDGTYEVELTTGAELYFKADGTPTGNR